MIREVKRIGDPVLRKKAKKVEKITRDVLKLIDDMLETMHHHNGVGLAAPQIGIPQRMFVVEMEHNDEIPGSGITYALINPELLRTDGALLTGAEGCLSIPGWRGDVERPTKAIIKGQDRHGNRIKVEVEGGIARAMLHELDHLDGVLYIDKLTAPDRIWQVDEAAVGVPAE